LEKLKDSKRELEELNEKQLNAARVSLRETALSLEELKAKSVSVFLNNQLEDQNKKMIELKEKLQTVAAEKTRNETELNGAQEGNETLYGNLNDILEEKKANEKRWRRL
jgi:hypothetical protein